MVKFFRAKRDTKYLGFIVGSGIVRTSPLKVAARFGSRIGLYRKHKNKLSILLLSIRFIQKIIHHFATCSLGFIDGFVSKIITRAISSFGY